MPPQNPDEWAKVRAKDRAETRGSAVNVTNETATPLLHAVIVYLPPYAYRQLQTELARVPEMLGDFGGPPSIDLSDVAFSCLLDGLDLRESRRVDERDGASADRARGELLAELASRLGKLIAAA